jgi:hypothetical protein
MAMVAATLYSMSKWLDAIREGSSVSHTSDSHDTASVHDVAEGAEVLVGTRKVSPNKRSASGEK